MNKRTVALRSGSVLLATIILALSGTMAWAAANDFRSRGLVPPGVTILGTDLSGMSEMQARDTVRRVVSAPLTRLVTVRAGETAYAFDPRPAVRVDVNAMVDEAYAPRRDASYLARLQSSVTNSPPPTEVSPAFSVDQTVIDEWLDTVTREVNKRAIDATLTVVGNRVRIRASKTGKRLDREAAATALREAFATENALANGGKTIEVPVRTLKPKVTERTLGKTIVVDISERRIRLFNGSKLEKAYRCAVGTPGFPTPRGRFEILQKRYMPTWVNPAPNGWGADMPPSIPPGPSNPLGTRALNLSAPGIRFHGTTNIGSIGTAASHGCMRMRRADIEDFYERVDVGTRVFIVE